MHVAIGVQAMLKQSACSAAYLIVENDNFIVNFYILH